MTNNEKKLAIALLTEKLQNLTNKKVIFERYKEDDTVYKVSCIDSEGNLKKLIEYIGEIGNSGHSFSIIVDPDDPEYERTFGWDGDGSDRVISVKKEQTVKEEQTPRFSPMQQHLGHGNYNPKPLSDEEKERRRRLAAMMAMKRKEGQPFWDEHGKPLDHYHAAQLVWKNYRWSANPILRRLQIVDALATQAGDETLESWRQLKDQYMKRTKSFNLVDLLNRDKTKANELGQKGKELLPNHEEFDY
jgi:hypothetical protein